MYDRYAYKQINKNKIKTYILNICSNQENN